LSSRGFLRPLASLHRIYALFKIRMTSFFNLFSRNAANAPQDSLSEADYARGQLWMVRFGIGNSAMEALITGAMLTALALQLGASNMMIGLLLAMPHMMSFMQIPGVWATEHFRERKKLTLRAAILSRPGILLMVVAVLMPTPSASIALLMLGLALRYGGGWMMNCAWASWIRDLVPEEIQGQYFGRRMALMTAATGAVTLAGGLFVDAWTAIHADSVKYAYGLLLIVAFGFGVYGNFALAKIPEPKMPPNDAPLHLPKLLSEPFRHENFRRVMLFLFSWNFAINLAVPFFTVHLLQSLQLSVTYVMFLAMLWQGASIASMRVWGSFIDRYSNKAVFRLSGPIYALGLLLWTLTDEWHQAGYAIYMLPLLYVMIGLATGGTALASNNIIFKLAPRGKATSYMAAANLLIALATALAPIMGGLMADWFANRALTLTLHWKDPNIETDLANFVINHWDFFFLTAGILGGIALQFVNTISEPTKNSREPAYREVVNHLAGSVYGIGFWRHFSNWPYLLRRRRKHEGHEDKTPPKPEAENNNHHVMRSF